MIRYDMDYNHPAIINLCMNCRRSDCPGICDQYKALVYELYQDGPIPIRAHDTVSRERRQGKRVLYQAFGETHSLREWAEKTGIHYATLYTRMTRKGMTLEQAIDAPDQKKLYDVGGEMLTMQEIAARTGIKYKTIMVRLQRGWTIDEVISSPVGKRVAR